MNYFPNLMALVCLLAFSACTREQPNDGEPYVYLKNEPSLKIAAGSQRTALVDFKIAEGYHILADHGEDTALHFTKLTIEGDDQVLVGSPQYPEPKTYQVEETDYQLSIFESDLLVKLPISVQKGTARSRHHLTGSLSYQACSAKKCFFPRELDFQLEVLVL